MTKVCCILLISLICGTIQAQPPFRLFGKVTDTAGNALFYATVQMVGGKDTAGTLTGEDGGFVFAGPSIRRFRLYVSMKGYLSFSRAFTVAEGRASLRLGPIILRADYSELDPVTVSRVRPISIAEDTVSYHAAAYPVRDGSDVEDILKRLPGVEIDMDGNVIVQGKKISKILVDGKEFFGSDVLLAIRNLPADVVDKLQIVDDYGDKARLTGVRSGDAAKVLNIVLKADKRNGQFGRAEAGAGDEGKYISNAFANAFKGERQVSAQAGAGNNNPAGSDFTRNEGGNYADQWNPHWGGAISLVNGSGSPHSVDSTAQINYYPGEQLQQTQDSRNSARNSHTNLETRLTYKPDNYSTLRLTASGTLQQADNRVSSLFTTLQQDSGYTKSSTGSSFNTSQTTGQTLNTNLYYERLSHYSRRRFSVDGGFGYSGSNAVNNSQSTATVITDSVSSNSLVHYLTTNVARNPNVHLNSSYFLPLGSTSFLELGYRVQSTISRTSVRTQQPDSTTGSLATIDSLSQQMLLRSLIQNIHTGYTAKLGRLELTAGLNAQPGTQKGTVDAKGDVTSYTYFSLLPNLQAAWNLDRSRRLNLSYNSQPNLPSLQQLAPFTNVSNPQYPVTGNPNLKPSYTDNLALHFEQSSLRPTQFFGFGMGLSYTTTRHTIIQNLTTPKDSSQIIQATTFLNAGTTDNNLTADYHVTLPAFLDKRLRVNMNGSLARSQTITMIDSIAYLSQAWAWNQSIHLQLLIPDLIESDLSGNYTLTRNSYAAAGSLPNSSRSAGVTLSSRHYILRHWIFNYQLTQPYTSNGDRLQAAPASLTASLQWQFLAHNKATLSLNGYNLLNQSAAASQSVSPTTVTETRPMLTGRYFLVTFLLKLSRFRK